MFPLQSHVSSLVTEFQVISVNKMVRQILFRYFTLSLHLTPALQPAFYPCSAFYPRSGKGRESVDSHKVLKDLNRAFSVFATTQMHQECLPFSQKIRKFRLKVKRNSNFPENPFENCGLPTEVVLFFRSERNVGNFLTNCTISQFQSLITENNNRKPNFKW